MMKKLRLICIVGLIAYGLQIIFTLYYSRNVFVMAQKGVSVYHRQAVNGYSYIPLLGLMFTYFHKYNEITIIFNDKRIIYEYESTDEDHIDFSGMCIERSDNTYIVYCETTFDKKVCLLKIEGNGLFDF